VQRGLPHEVLLELRQELVVVVYRREVGLDAESHTRLLKTIEHVAIAGILQHLLERIVIELLVSQLHVSQQLAAASDKKHSASDQVAGGAHLTWVDIAQRKGSATHQPSDLLAVELVVLLLPSMNGLHVQSVAEDERDLLHQAEVSQPVPGEHALGAHNQVVTEAVDGVHELARLGPDVSVQKLVAIMVEDAQVHPLRVQVHATIVSMLDVVESHHGPPW
jgi:hypothetical protein